ncbi:MAG: PepSY domain-containing protein [Propionibacteriaceae bacterium]|nr:PepSY domain-containing protein [Propionibacteriaceae bacterium]
MAKKMIMPIRGRFIALAAAACLGIAGCSSTSAPETTPTPNDVATTVVGSTEPTSVESATSDSPASATESPAESASSDSGSSTGEDVDLATQTFAVTPQQAIDKGLEKSGDGIVHSIELDWSRRSNAWVYELDILVGNTDNDVEVHADTGEILDHEQDDTDDQEQAIDLGSPMTWETARDKALGAVQGRITSWKLEWDDNYTSYEFDIEDSSGDEIEVEVNVQTGDVSIDD